MFTAGRLIGDTLENKIINISNSDDLKDYKDEINRSGDLNNLYVYKGKYKVNSNIRVKCQ